MKVIIKFKDELLQTKQTFIKDWSSKEYLWVFDYLVEYAFSCLTRHSDTEAGAYMMGMSHIPQLPYSALIEAGIDQECIYDLEELFLQIYADLAEKIIYLFPTREQRHQIGQRTLCRIGSDDLFILN